jgi:hypothetical protein
MSKHVSGQCERISLGDVYSRKLGSRKMQDKRKLTLKTPNK